MTEHAHKALPGLTLFFSKRAAQIRKHEQLVRRAVLAKSAAVDLPSSRAARKRHLKRASAFTAEAIDQTEISRALTYKPLGGLTEQTLARTIHELELLIAVKREDRDFDLSHYGSQQRRRFQRAESLLAQYLPEEINLEHCFPQWIVSGCPSGSNREVALTQSSKQVRESLKRKDNALPERVGEA
jgi:hypothetical protein